MSHDETFLGIAKVKEQQSKIKINQGINPNIPAATMD